MLFVLVACRFRGDDCTPPRLFEQDDFRFAVGSLSRGRSSDCALCGMTLGELGGDMATKDEDVDDDKNDEVLW